METMAGTVVKQSHMSHGPERPALAMADDYYVIKSVDDPAYKLLWNTSAHSVWYLRVYNLILIYALGAVS